MRNILVTFAVVLLILSGGWNLHKHFAAPTIIQAVPEDMDSSRDLIVKNFRKWTANTIEAGVLVDWRGDDSEIIYIEHRAGFTSTTGQTMPSTWTVWARTSLGSLYTVDLFDLENSFKRQSAALPQRVTQQQLLEALVRKGEFDLIDSLKIPRKSA